jgi:hypothetical protein
VLDFSVNFTNKSRKKMLKGLLALRKASIYAHRIDWLLSGDDSEDTFLKRLKEELEYEEDFKQKLLKYAEV